MLKLIFNNNEIPSISGVRLSPRQWDVLSLAMTGKGEKQIATALGIRQHTVHDHFKSLIADLATNIPMISGRREVIAVLLKEHPDIANLCEDDIQAFADAYNLLAPRERQTIWHMADGLAEKHIAVELDLTTYTVHDYVKNIYRKLQVSSKEEVMVVMRILEANGAVINPDAPSALPLEPIVS